MNEISYSGGDTSFTFTPVPWDCKAFARDCYELKLSLGGDRPQPAAVQAAMRQAGMDVVTCRRGADDFEAARYLRSLGFFHAELQLDYLLALAGRALPPAGPALVRPARPDDDEAMLQIAATRFPGGRFRHWTGVTAEMIGVRYRNWVAQILERHRDLALVLETDGRVLGFFASEPTTDPKRVNLTLGAVAQAAPRLLGHHLFTSALALYGQRGYTLAGASLAANNLAVLNLYASLGAAFVKAVEFFQWDARAGETGGHGA